jgi:DNA-binding GntR family transcriptional regulator
MSQARFPVVKSVALREWVAEAIRQALLEGCFKPGQDLSDIAIAKEMNVSRGPVREALLVLAQQGLITHLQNHGFSVLGFTDRNHQGIDPVRLELETLALTLARSRVIAEDLERVRAANARMAPAFRTNSSAAWIKAELEFHGLIWELSGNRWLGQCLRYIMVPCFNYETAFRLEPQITDLQFAEQYQIYVDFLEGTSSRTAEQCVRFHLGMREASAAGCSEDFETMTPKG